MPFDPQDDKPSRDPWWNPNRLNQLKPWQCVVLSIIFLALAMLMIRHLMLTMDQFYRDGGL